MFVVDAVSTTTPTTTKTQTFLPEKLKLEVTANAIPMKHGITLARGLVESEHGL